MGTLLRDTGTVFWRAMRLSLRNPAWLVIMMMQPILYIVLFGPLLEPLSGQLGAGNAYQIFVPGILVQLGIFGSLFVGFGLIAEYRAGVIESQRVTPASRTALLLGRVLRDVVVLLVQGTLLVLVSHPARTAGAGARRRPHAAGRRAAGGGVRVDLLRAGADAEERGRVRAAAQRVRAPGAAAVGDPAADDAGARPGCRRSATSTRSSTSSRAPASSSSAATTPRSRGGAPG